MWEFPQGFWWPSETSVGFSSLFFIRGCVKNLAANEKALGSYFGFYIQASNFILLLLEVTLHGG